MWRNGNTMSSTPGQLPLLADPPTRHVVSKTYPLFSINMIVIISNMGIEVINIPLILISYVIIFLWQGNNSIRTRRGFEKVFER